MNRWHTRRVATSVYEFARVDSTQSEARRLIAAGRADGALVLAAEQSAGHGRFERVWQSPPGNVYMSFVLQPLPPLPAWPQLLMAASLALAETLDALGVADAGLKWPNDVLIDGRKVAGLLAEVEGDYLILGIGLNANAPLPPDLPRATSIAAALGRPADVDAALRAFVGRFDRYAIELENGRPLHERWAARLVTLGRTVRIRSGDEIIEGTAEGVEPDGALRLRQPGGRVRICHGGEVTLSI